MTTCGDEEDFLRAADYFSLHYEAHADAESACILAHAARIQNSVDDFFSICLKDMCSSSCSEICYEIGQYYRERQNPQEASLWFYNAAFETQPVLDIEISGKKALLRLAECGCALAVVELPDAGLAEALPKMPCQSRRCPVSDCCRLPDRWRWSSKAPHGCPDHRCGRCPAQGCGRREARLRDLY